MSVVKNGDRVGIIYTGRLQDGEVFDSNEGGEPLEFTVGAGEVIPGLERELVGMAPGDTKTITIPPELAYGPHDPQLTQVVPRDMLPDEVEMGACLQTEVDEQEILLWVTGLDDKEGVLDANHPLAGKTLTFDIKLDSVLAAN